MNSQILPKNRALHANNSRMPSGRVGSISENRSGLKLSKRLGSGNRILSNHRIISNTRHGSRNLGIEDDLDSSFNDENAIRFDENKHTILSNFEEWIKLSTDNKITSKNSWQFALIDYFHDLNVIKDGETINFQRASATLDGCVKIYLSRVESAATETGKLLSGLAKNKNNNEVDSLQENEVEDENESNNEEDTEGDGKKKRKINRVVESTLVPFESIVVKKFDQELAIDPLFKKALAEFDEGGAKSLLLNTLSIDSTGRVIFDATTNPISEGFKEPQEVHKTSDNALDLSGLEALLFDEDGLNDTSICPSMPQIKSVVGDISRAKSILNDVNNQFNLETGLDVAGTKDENFENFDYEDYGAELDNDVGGDDNDANEPINNLNQSIVQQIFNEPEQLVEKSHSAEVLDRDLMVYFDQRLKANWRGPEHWKVTALKKSKNLDLKEESATKVNKDSQSTKSKKLQIIDFLSSDKDDFESSLFEHPKSITSINKPVSVKEEANDNLLPEDIRYSSSKLTNLFTKPQVPILCFMRRKAKPNDSKSVTDEKFFAQHYREQELECENDKMAASFHQAEFEDFNNDFGGDADLDGIDFNDALDTNGRDQPLSSQVPEGLKLRPENITFSKVAKRVDVKLLKDNIWKTIKEEHDSPSSVKMETDSNTNVSQDDPEVKPHEQEKPTINFTDMFTSLGSLYATEQRKDISTSFCFICLLHLANEHGLTISSNERYDDLRISGF
ncbi:uncharacterized protein PRCAT00000288001 [Priceomyces carsonii]|uniref:uncharacterized protein n=1 Tax=Priceomyces carsonii TaxID=28549 RepID=UPI002ED7E147|nr:unnamed protein product [Priceomyces carsonii]